MYNPTGVPAGIDTIPVVVFNTGTGAPGAIGKAGLITIIITSFAFTEPGAPEFRLSLSKTFPTFQTPSKAAFPFVEKKSTTAFTVGDTFKVEVEIVQ